MVDHAIFSKDGPNLNNPAETKRPSVIPNKYRLKKRNAKGRPSFSKDIPNKGEVNSIAGIKPINALIKAVKTRETIISLIFIGAINKFVKFLLQISSRNIILKLILARKRKSYKIAAVSITPTVLL